MREWRVDLPRLERNTPAFLLREVLERAHVVNTVSELHQDHPCVLRPGEEHLGSTPFWRTVELRYFSPRCGSRAFVGFCDVGDEFSCGRAWCFSW